MNISLSKTSITSYCGNVIPLYLKADTDISQDNIIWSSSEDIVHIKTFAEEKEFPFSHGVLITLLKEGNTDIICQHNNKKYICKLNITERKHAEKTDALKPFVADLHIHSSHEHDHEKFAVRQTEFAEDLVESIAAVDLLDCAVISDHGSTLNPRDFFRGFIADEEVNHEGITFFPGAESEVTLIEKDRFGLPRKNSGEIVTLNACTYADSYTWEDFYKKMESSPYAISILAHPSVLGWDENGIWNFCLYQNSRRPEFRKMVNMIEVGQGAYREEDVLQQYLYSVALDCGLKVSPCGSSDSHGAYTPDVVKTMLLAPDNSKEMLYDAILNNRLYASESGALNLKFTVNGAIMGETLLPCSEYHFHIEASVIEGKKGNIPTECNLVSDYGKKILTVPFDGCADFSITSDSARYFYVLLTDEKGNKTWSSPVWTGRAFDDFSCFDTLEAIDKSNFTALDEKNGMPVPEVINDNPRVSWTSTKTNASIIIDMGREYTVSAVSYCAPPVYRGEIPRDKITDKVIEFVSEYKISLSLDGTNYDLAGTGAVRIYGGESMLPIKTSKARYVKFEAVNTVGKDSKKEEFADAKVSIGEISIFKAL